MGKLPLMPVSVGVIILAQWLRKESIEMMLLVENFSSYNLNTTESLENKA